MRAANISFLAISSLLFASDGGTQGDWPSYGGTYAAWRYSDLNQIHTGNVGSLTPAWVFQTGDYDNGFQATPIALDGVLYVSTSSSWAFALDGATGRVIWEYHFPLSSDYRALGYGKQNRGVAVAHGLVFLGTADNHLVALDQKTGEEV